MSMTIVTFQSSLLALSLVLGCDVPTAVEQGGGRPEAAFQQPTDWREAEKYVLADHVQLTSADRFVKAGESYFSPDDRKIIFQAVEQPPAGKNADDFYAMFIADVKRDANGRITGIDNIKRISPEGSANTCGWFHPTDPNIVIFGSTIDAPKFDRNEAFERMGERYKWMFPSNMRVVRCRLDKEGAANDIEVIAGDGNAYAAECVLSPDGRHLLYCSLEGERGDLFVKDLRTSAVHRVVQSKGYDGGPFFSPDGQRICYRSDRRNEHYLQLYVADLAFNETGEIVGIAREHQLTDDDVLVHWCPFWTVDGRRLVYASSELGHTNYEVFMIDADPGNLPGSTGTVKYGTRKRRITFADRADVLPAFSHDGKTMVWTSQRGEDGESQVWAARFILNADSTIRPDEPARRPSRPAQDDRIVIEDRETGRIFMYDRATHKVSEYHMDTHTLTEITDPELMRHVAELYEQQQREAD
jgi:TolB protein